MTYSKEQIIEALTEYAQKSGAKRWSEWYVGISKNARNRLFNEHSVKENGDWWIFRQATSSSVARDVEAHFVNTLGADGGTGGGDHTADLVYGYMKARHTNP
jgi:hypothetical protein